MSGVIASLRFSRSLRNSATSCVRSIRGIRRSSFVAEFSMHSASYPAQCPRRPIDVAYLILYLASDESLMANGARFALDRGVTIMEGVAR